jgi:hypothetical protein
LSCRVKPDTTNCKEPETVPNWIELYTRQLDDLDKSGLTGLLDAGRRWNLAPTLEDRGVVVFAHAAPLDCGHQTAAAVHACLDSGADKVLVVGVQHAWTPEMQAARQAAVDGADLTGHPLRGLHGPDLPNSRSGWQLDHSLLAWRRLWQAECARRGVAGPQVREVYPFLAGPQPDTLRNYDIVARWAEDAVVVATTDAFHHGIGYGDGPDVAREPTAGGGLALAAASIAESQRRLAAGDYASYLRHCVVARNDARDTGPFYRALRGPFTCSVLDLIASDMAAIYAAPPPTWVAAALMACRPV